jgi:hypothetical protein
MSTLQESQDYLNTFSRHASSLESGRLSLEQMAMFIENGGLDASTKAYFIQLVSASLPEYIASFDVLLTALGLPTNSTPPTP